MHRVWQSCAAASLAALLAFLLPATGGASPWTLPDNQIVFTFSTDAQIARNEYLLDGTHQSYPLDGEYLAINLRPGLRVGITDSTEIGIRSTITFASYEAAEAYFEPEPSDDLTLPEVRDGIISFDRRVIGLGDIYAYVRHRVTDPGRVAVALELELKFPTGYQPLTDALDGDADAPENGPVDDVTLGDGQLDATARVLFGWAPPGGWFVRLDGGFRARFFGPGQQVVGAFKLGRAVVPAWIPYVVVDTEIAVTEGEVVGQTFNTDAPDTPARDFDADLVFLTDLRLDRSWLRPGIGSIFRLGEREIDISYSLIVWGENVGQVHTISIGTPFVL